MARERARLIGKLYCDPLAEDSAIIWVYEKGRYFEIRYGEKSHLCHAIVKDIEHVKQEAFLVFHVKAELFESCH